MNDLIVFSIICVTLLSILIPAVLIVFKKSIIGIISVSLLFVSATVALLAYIIARIGLVHLTWVTPIVLFILLGIIMFLRIKLIKPINQLTEDIVNKLSKGKLNYSFKNELSQRKDELGRITNALEVMRIKLIETIAEINKISFSISSSANSQSNAARQISQDSSTQAASIEEVSSSIEEIASNIQNNASNAQETEKNSLAAQQGIEIVFDQSKQSFSATKNITDKIEIINDIAFQTNILALNAAVEAARAGEYGKGFAVVAAEVRKLAERSKVAAEDIVKLAKNNLDLADGAGKNMAEMVPKVKRTTELVQEIAAASMEQNNGANQVNNSTQQLNTITQKNAAASEELATNAEELASLSIKLKELMSYFEVDNVTNFSVIKENTSIQKPNLVTHQAENQSGVIF
jgi:methyl-accepting chemotaxis protein